MDRRAFFQSTLQKTGKTVVRQVDARVSRRAARWIRPPFALDELEFLLACTRCGDCIEACPHRVVFTLPTRVGAQAAGTPALDLLNRGCHLCEDWPCVQACEPQALNRPPAPDAGDKDDIPLPRIAAADIDPRTCLPYTGPECGACAASCPVPGALLWERERPCIDPGRCVGCGMCREACIVDPKAIAIRSLHA